jgi:hypothetical protein
MFVLKTTELLLLYVTSNMKDIGNNIATTMYVSAHNCHGLTGTYTYGVRS